MIEEEAVVARVEPERVWVEKARQSACSSCKENCATAVMGDALGSKINTFSVVSAIDVRPGDRVVIGIQEEALVLGSLGIYLFPLVGLLLGAMLGKSVAAGSGDTEAMIGGILGLGLALIAVRMMPLRTRNRFQPQVLRKIG